MPGRVMLLVQLGNDQMLWQTLPMNSSNWRTSTVSVIPGSSPSALDLADALGTSPKLWMNLQATYDLDRAISARNVA